MIIQATAVVHIAAEEEDDYIEAERPSQYIIPLFISNMLHANKKRTSFMA